MFWVILRHGPSRTNASDVIKKDQKTLKKLLAGGVQPVRVVLRAVALLQMAKRRELRHGSRPVVPLTAQAHPEGRPSIPAGRPAAGIVREGAAPEPRRCWRTASASASLPWACSDPPEGPAPRWTVRLLVEEAVKARTGAAELGRENRPDFAAPPRPQAVAGKKNVVRGGNSMRTTSPGWRDVLETYEPKQPVVCRGREARQPARRHPPLPSAVRAPDAKPDAINEYKTQR